MAISQLPAEFPIALVPGDELNFALRFNLDLTGYILQGRVYDSSLATSTLLGFPAVTATVETTTPEDPEEDPVTTTLVEVSFDEMDTAQLTPIQARRWRWFLRWTSPGGVTRTILSGPITSRAP
jgi:hypothetical protein